MGQSMSRVQEEKANIKKLFFDEISKKIRYLDELCCFIIIFILEPISRAHLQIKYTFESHAFRKIIMRKSKVTRSL